MVNIKDTVSKIKSGKQSCRELLDEYIPVILDGQEKLNTYITLLLDSAKERAESLDARIAAGDSSGDLLGIPVAIKDNMMLSGTRTTCGSKILENYISPYTATAVGKLIDAGAVIVGKTNMDEFAMGSSGETSFFGPARNPNDPDRIPGGSSSGSAACVADSQVMGSLGSDTGGSIRQPAAMCGVVGMKPTYGYVSRYGLVAFASSLDQIGPFASNVEDAARIFTVIAGFDEKDSTSIAPGESDFVRWVHEKGMKLKIGIPREYMGGGLSGEIHNRIADTARRLERSGFEIKDISLPLTKYAVAAYYIVAPAEASANLARYDGVKYGYRTPSPDDLLEEYKVSRQEGFGDEVKRRIMIGTYALSSGYYDAYYLKAQRVRRLMERDFQEAFGDVDIILSPTSPTTAFKLGEKTQDPLQMYLSDIYTISCNLVGLPGINVPVGKDSAGLPIGAQLIAPWRCDGKLLYAARQVEKIYE
ncbi:MAG: Asp-tRNA(Asn)/Glu-tRNA(Gln) amidotransferase subunit GatA [Elusimicrobia bacterium]|nr:Asp-tRNA(Asn)/Glu-tRNA(Gln) amidotransferase subunit GatA [Elusimicrobiota bacterium]